MGPHSAGCRWPGKGLVTACPLCAARQTAPPAGALDVLALSRCGREGGGQCEVSAFPLGQGRRSCGFAFFFGLRCLRRGVGGRRVGRACLNPCQSWVLFLLTSTCVAARPPAGQRFTPPRWPAASLAAHPWVWGARLHRRCLVRVLQQSPREGGTRMRGHGGCSVNNASTLGAEAHLSSGVQLWEGTSWVGMGSGVCVGCLQYPTGGGPKCTPCFAAPARGGAHATLSPCGG